MAVSIYDYTDYRAYLDAWLNEKKSRSVRGLAQRLEVSPAQVSMVRSGRRNLNLEHARHWAWGLRLENNEADHWDAMVRAAHAPSDRMKGLAQRQLEAAQAWQNAMRATKALQAFNNWFAYSIMEMTRLPGFEASGEWIGPRLSPAVPPDQAQETLDLLLALEVLRRDDEGRIVPSPMPLTTGMDVSDTAAAAVTMRNHRAWLNYGVDALGMPPELRYVARVVVTLDQARLREVVEVVHRLQIEAAETASKQNPTHVYEIGVAVLPRTVTDPDA